MENFYLNTHEDHPELLMFGGTKGTCEERLNGHNTKAVIGEWVNQHCEDVENYRKIEKYFFDHYGKLSPEGESEEIVEMTLEEGMYVLDSAMGKPTTTSPFALRFYEEMNSYATKMTDVETLATLQTRPETANAHIKKLAESMEINGYFEAEPLVLWINDGKIRVVSGHHRMWAAKMAGIDEVPAMFLPKYFDEKTVKDIGWLTNVDHNIALQLTDKAVKSKIETDAIKYGIDFIETQGYKQDCMKLFNRGARSIGKFVGSVKKQSEQKKLEEASPFRYSKEEIEAEEERQKIAKPNTHIAMINGANWSEQMGGNLIKALEKASKPAIDFNVFYSKLVDTSQVAAAMKKIVEAADRLTLLGIQNSVKKINQTDE